MIFRRLCIASANDVAGVGREARLVIQRSNIAKIQENIAVKCNQSVPCKFTIGHCYCITNQNQHPLRV